MANKYNDLDDFDHFLTKSVVINDFYLDTMSNRDALKRIMNHLLDRQYSYVGDLSLITFLSIEKTECLLKHLMNQNEVRSLTEDEKTKLSLHKDAQVVKSCQEFCQKVTAE